MQDTQTVFFLGKPGCGKGTQAKLLSEKTAWPVFSSGKLFREIEKEDTPVGRKIKHENTAGMLSPHWFAMYLYLKCLFSVPGETSVIFDGFNRKIQEAELIVNSLKWLERPFIVLHIAVSDDEARRRIAGRLKIEGRADDRAVDERLKEYEEFTEPAIRFFREAGTLVDIDGMPDPETIAGDVRSALGLPLQTGSGRAA